jgi:hypothetical protein
MVGKVAVKARPASPITIPALSQPNLCLWPEAPLTVGRANPEDRRNDEVSKRSDLGVFRKSLVYAAILTVMIV